MRSVFRSDNLFFLAMQEAFISIFPYVILSSALLLITHFFTYLFPEVDIGFLVTISTFLRHFFPFLLMISIAHYLSNRYAVSNSLAISLSIAIILTLAILHSGNVVSALVFDHRSFLAVIVPISTVFLLRKYESNDLSLHEIHVKLSHTIQFIIPFFLIYIGSTLVYYMFITLIELRFIDLLWNTTPLLEMPLRAILSSMFWFVGIHGEHIITSIVGEGYMQRSFISGMTLKQFYDLFVIIGGSGAALSIVLAVLLVKTEKKSIKYIAKVALPFTIFNISEVVIYGLPIVFNKRLFIPFVLVPVANMVVAFTFLTLFGSNVEVSNNVIWMMPVFFDTYFTFNGNVWLMLLQLGLLVMDVAIYMPFIKKYIDEYAPEPIVEKLRRKLDISLNFQVKKDISFYKAQSEVMDANRKLDRVIQMISQSELLVYYQPIVHRQGSEIYYEALLRIKERESGLKGPYFLEMFEKAGLVPMIDLWVAKNVAKMLDTLLEYHKEIPYISLNLYPDTLNDTIIMEKIMMHLKGKKIIFEILERGFLENRYAKKNLLKLSENGFKIALDDMGHGYSSFAMLYELPIHSVKIDRSLIHKLEDEKARKVLQSLITLCQTLGYKSVAEGVETHAQYLRLKSMGIDYIQGFYFAKAMPLSEAIYFTIEKQGERQERGMSL
jgi:lactose/cellobiose-specific phosphotransferase system IIC component